MAATPETVQQTIECLAEVYPQFVANDLALAVENITSLIEKVRDPLETLRDINVDDVLSATDLTAGDEIWDNVAVVAAGLTEKFTRRTVDNIYDQIETEVVGSKRVQDIRNLSNKVVNRTAILLGFTPDMPYAAAQRTCELIISTTELKVKNLRCVQTHIIQLVNAIIVLAENVDDFKDDLFGDLGLVKSELTRASLELVRTQKLVNGEVGFDVEAFKRAEGALRNANAVLSPPKGDESIIELTRILSLGDVETAQVSKSNVALVRTIIPALAQLIEQEAAAYKQHVTAINTLVQSLSEVTQQYEDAGETTRLKEQRARGIATIKNRIDDLCNRVSLAITQQVVTAASQEMLDWISKIKGCISMMDELKKLNYQVGSASEVESAQLQANLAQLNEDLSKLEDDLTDAGIEDSSTLSNQLVSLSKGAMRILDDFDKGRATEVGIKTLHTIAAVVAGDGVNGIDKSIALAQDQALICAPFVSLKLSARVLFDKGVDMLNQAGLDLGVDLFRQGRFKDFLDKDTNELTYVGAAAGCLTEALLGIDDDFTRQKISDIRDKLVADQVTMQYAAADSADFGIVKQIESFQARIQEIQENAKQVEAIVSQLTQLLESLGGAQSPVSSVTTFARNLTKLSVGAGGRLASQLERFSDHANGGVVEC